MRFLLIAILLFGCKSKKEVESTVRDPNIAAKAGVYMDLHRGYAHDKCDSVGFTALCKMTGGCQDADLFASQGQPGQWFRSPEKDCLDKGESSSDISKDMFVMLFNYFYSVKNKDALVDIKDYGAANNWVMGRHDGTADGFARVFMPPDMSLMLVSMIDGINTGEENTNFPINSGFRAHLDVLWLFLKAQTQGYLSEMDYSTIKEQAKREPRNALFQAMKSRFDDGDQSAAIGILSDETLFPSSRLPAASDRCEEYLWQRDNGSDWAPCDKAGKVHDGVDFLLAAWVAGQL